jgi:hypothetical protein
MDSLFHHYAFVDSMVQYRTLGPMTVYGEQRSRSQPGMIYEQAEELPKAPSRLILSHLSSFLTRLQTSRNGHIPLST